MKPKKRRYVLKARGEQVAETKARITDAILQLHQELGPRHTTVSAIAERAGVERLTVYRHFEDDDAIYAACSQRYLEVHPPPQAEAWAGVMDPLLRTERGLQAIYGYFSRTAPLYARVYADVDEIPALAKVLAGFDAHLQSLADDLASTWKPDADASRRSVILRHAVGFATWQSFENLRVNDARKARLMVEWLTAPALAEHPAQMSAKPAPKSRVGKATAVQSR